MEIQKKYDNYINGSFHKSEEYLEVYNPATEKIIALTPSSRDNAVESAISSARIAQKKWAMIPANDRAALLHKLANKIRENSDFLSKIIILEGGKTKSLAATEVNFTADYIDYMAEWGRRIEGEIIQSDRENENIFLFRKPLGVVAGILPWNFPFFLIARKMAPALITGNTIVIKPSEETPINCFEFARLFDEVGFPKGVFNVIGGTGEKVGKLITKSRKIDMISFTGSVNTGSKIMENSAENVTKLNLELGGKAPAIVLDDANIDLAVKSIKGSRIINSGQVCNCAERVYVQRGIANEFIDKVSAAMSSTTFGDPSLDQNFDMGPLINRDGLTKVSEMVDRAKSQGGEVLTGGKVSSESTGYYYHPTVISNCSQDMEIMKKEIFGPVLPIQIVEDLDEAIYLSNDSDYGLTSSIYTNSLKNTLHACRNLDFGETYVNRENFEAMQGFHAGVRKSGVGGADGKHGLYEYTHSHVVYIET